MSLYNMLFGQNAQTDLLLAVIGLKRSDVERLRDVFASDDGAKISVYTRTGGGNRDSYQNLTMRKRPEWGGSVDDDFDSTYCTDTFTVPEEWRNDVAGLLNPLEHGLRAEFCRHLGKTLNRAPTPGDVSEAAYAAEAAKLRRTNHWMANGHTFVPHDDSAMRVALGIAEKNGGKLRTAWGIAPLAFKISGPGYRYPNANTEQSRDYRRFLVDYSSSFEIDAEYWAHCKQVFGAEFPISMAEIQKAMDKK